MGSSFAKRARPQSYCLLLFVVRRLRLFSVSVRPFTKVLLPLANWPRAVCAMAFMSQLTLRPLHFVSVFVLRLNHSFVVLDSQATASLICQRPLFGPSTSSDNSMLTTEKPLRWVKSVHVSVSVFPTHFLAHLPERFIAVFLSQACCHTRLH